MTYKFLQYFFLAMVLLACEAAPKKEKIPLSQLQERLGKETIESIAYPKGVDVARMVKIQGHFVFDTNRRALSANEVEQLQKLLLNGNGYIFDKQKKCLFIPELAFNISGKKELIILVSPICKQIKIDDSKRAVVLDYDPM